eukprot:scaffold5316_cov90-Skeletonema_dohrnii-CCMP3373.AAC.1
MLWPCGAGRRPQAQIGPHQSSGLSRGCSIADMCDSALALDNLLRNCSSRHQRYGPLAPVYAHIDSDRQERCRWATKDRYNT